MTETHCMLDIETLSRSNTAAIVSIGACRFTVDDGITDDFYIEVDPEDCQANGLDVDVSTLMWWLETDPQEAQATLPGGKPLSIGLRQFSHFYGDCDTIWAKSPAFDCVILENAYDVCDLKVPWDYWSTRDVRTLMDLSAAVDTGQNGTKHNAKDDAASQAQNIIKTLEILDE
jgi:hypothetical protein